MRKVRPLSPRKSTLIGCATLALTLSIGLATAQQYSIEFEDDQGSMVRLASPPKRILSLNPFATEIFWFLGASDRLVGVDPFVAQDFDFQGATIIHNPMAPDPEGILALRPDLVILSQIAPIYQRRLEGVGLTVCSLFPSNWKGIYQSIQRLGEVVGKLEAAASMIRNMQDRVRAVEKKVQTQKHPRPKVFVEIWPRPLRTAGPGAFIHDLIEMAGGENIASDTSTHYPQFSEETLIQRNPDAIITTMPVTYQELMEGRRNRWSSLRAIQTKKILLIDQNLMSRPGPRLVEALEQIFHFLLPSP